MKLLLCELDVLLAEDSASGLAALLPDGAALLARLRRVAPQRASAPEDGSAALHHLLLPFLALHQVNAEALTIAGRSAPLAEGASAFVAALSRRGWAIRLCSSAYQPYPSAIAGRLGLSEEQALATPYPADALNADLGAYALASISELGEDLCNLPSDDVAALAARVERFYASDISYSGFAETLASTAPLLGHDWVTLAEQAITDLGLSWSQTAVVGCSAAVGPLLNAVRAGGGLAVAVGSEAPPTTISFGDLAGLLSSLEVMEKP